MYSVALMGLLIMLSKISQQKGKISSWMALMVGMSVADQGISGYMIYHLVQIKTIEFLGFMILIQLFKIFH
jgi:hypothetical protein